MKNLINERSKYEYIQNKLEIKNSLLKHIYEITILLAGSASLDEVLEQIINRVMTGLKFDRAAILLLSNDEKRLDCSCIKGFSNIGRIRAEKYPIILAKHNCYESKVIKSGNILFIKDIPTDSTATNIDRVINEYQERKSILYVPLKLKNRVLGMIGVDRYNTKMEITQDDVESLTIFANAAAIIIENAKYFTALQEEQMLSKKIIESSISGIILTDVKGYTQKLNPMAEQILGVDIDELKDISLKDIFDIDEGEKRRIINIWKNKESITGLELPYNRIDKRMLIDIKIFPLHTNGKVQNLVFMINDITEKKKFDEYLLRLHKFAGLGRIASGVAHEIRNPLTAIYTVVQYLEKEIGEHNIHETCFVNLKDEIGRIEKLIRQLLDLSRPLPLQVVRTNVRELLMSIVMLVSVQASGKGIVIKTDFKDINETIIVDPDRMKQVLLNLLINAMESIINRKGSILISAKKEIDPDNGENWVLIEINDNGSGVPDEIIGNIFDPFFSTKKTGTGLGLSISHKIIREHGGTIDVVSKNNKGTTFIIKLPIQID